jgi:hypothetical protein
MSQSKSKKLRKEVRREVGKKYTQGIATLGEIVRPRPKWIPKRIWILAYLPLFKRKHLKLIYRQIVQTEVERKFNSKSDKLN